MPDASSHDISEQAATIIAALGGGGVVGAFLREAASWLLGHGKQGAEAKKINAEAERALNELVDDRIKLLLDAEAKANAQLRSDLARCWRYIEKLRAHIEEIRALLVENEITAPRPPAFDAPDQPPNGDVRDLKHIV
ncbi:hypothetical protein [Methylosinus sp. PW1]|uniref:hypothetical protein n=1 Tax=Methylosinus sp. PW1 TaxID=107636 RepID=UPI000563D123|nr:hypothetical protein [Methylosinus sp. PW1]